MKTSHTLVRIIGYQDALLGKSIAAFNQYELPSNLRPSYEAGFRAAAKVMLTKVVTLRLPPRQR